MPVFCSNEAFGISKPNAEEAPKTDARQSVEEIAKSTADLMKKIDEIPGFKPNIAKLPTQENNATSFVPSLSGSFHSAKLDVKEVPPSWWWWPLSVEQKQVFLFCRGVQMLVKKLRIPR
jgi:hypothetical protein